MEMKKTYIAPEIEVIELEMETALMGLSSQGSLPGTSDGGDSEGGMDADANDRRGGWGNLWE
jgi:hypothetical protein